jgi:hypothetical protein
VHEKIVGIHFFAKKILIYCKSSSEVQSTSNVIKVTIKVSRLSNEYYCCQMCHWRAAIAAPLLELVTDNGPKVFVHMPERTNKLAPQSSLFSSLIDL